MHGWTISVIGAGRIVPWHVESLQAAGFRLGTLGTRPGSTNVNDLVQRYPFEAVAATWQGVLGSPADAFLIASATSVIPEILRAAIPLGKPILVEKPVAQDAAEIRELDALARDHSTAVLVGYNRRHYSSTAAMRQWLSQITEPVSFSAMIPETSWDPRLPDADKRAVLRGNSVHVLDLLRHLLGPLTVIGSGGLDGSYGISSRTCLLAAAERRAVGTVTITFGAPWNAALDVFADGESASLRPIELFSLHTGVQVIEPTTESPLRRYVVSGPDDFVLDSADVDHKPGFLRQAQELLSCVSGEQSADRVSATLAQAAEAQDLAEVLLQAVLSSG